MKSLVLMALLHMFHVTHGDVKESYAQAAREAIDEQIKRVMNDNGSYKSKTLQYSLRFSSTSADTEKANKVCRENGGRRINLNSQKKLDIFNKQGHNYWTGGTRESPLDEFKWSTGEYVEPSNLDWKTGYEGGLCLEAGDTNIAWRFYCSTENSRVACEYDEWVELDSSDTLVKLATTIIVIPQELTYEQADAKCKEFDGGNGKLAMPSTFKMIETMEELMSKFDASKVYWLGSRRNRTLDNTWNNGFQIVPNLKELHQEDGGSCLRYNANGKFDFQNCDEKTYGFVCQTDTEHCICSF